MLADACRFLLVKHLPCWGRVCNVLMQLLLGLISTVTLRSKSHRTRNHILLSLLGLGSLFIPSYGSECYGRSILNCLHMGFKTEINWRWYWPFLYNLSSTKYKISLSVLLHLCIPSGNICWLLIFALSKLSNANFYSFHYSSIQLSCQSVTWEITFNINLKLGGRVHIFL